MQLFGGGVGTPIFGEQVFLGAPGVSDCNVAVA